MSAPVSRRKTARFYDPDGVAMPCCRSCWRVDVVLRRGACWVEARRAGGPIAHQNRRCRSIRPGSVVEQDVAVAYLDPTPAVGTVIDNRANNVA